MTIKDWKRDEPSRVKQFQCPACQGIFEGVWIHAGFSDQDWWTCSQCPAILTLDWYDEPYCWLKTASPFVHEARIQVAIRDNLNVCPCGGAFHPAHVLRCPKCLKAFDLTFYRRYHNPYRYIFKDAETTARYYQLMEVEKLAAGFEELEKFTKEKGLHYPELGPLVKALRRRDLAKHQEAIQVHEVIYRELQGKGDWLPQDPKSQQARQEEFETTREKVEDEFIQDGLLIKVEDPCAVLEIYYLITTAVYDGNKMFKMDRLTPDFCELVAEPLLWEKKGSEYESHLRQQDKAASALSHLFNREPFDWKAQVPDETRRARVKAWREWWLTHRESTREGASN